ncbi:unnamed protein product [Musa acuminata subsp. burmannicoides]
MKQNKKAISLSHLRHCPHLFDVQFIQLQKVDSHRNKKRKKLQNYGSNKTNRCYRNAEDERSAVNGSDHPHQSSLSVRSCEYVAYDARILTLVRGTNRLDWEHQNEEGFRGGLFLLPSPMAPKVVSLFFFLSMSTVSELGGIYGSGGYPIVVSTWPFREAVRAAWRSVNDHCSSAVDAVVDGCSACEELRCDGTVGPGGSPDETGETTLDALVMDGTTMEVGAVAAMRNVKDGIKAAKLVMDYTEHTMLVGEKASIFAISMGLPGPTNLSSSESIEKWVKWKGNNCQPNFRKNVVPAKSCGPYHVHYDSSSALERSCGLSREGSGERSLFGDGNHLQTPEHKSNIISYHNHDTISMATIDKMGHIAVGTSTNGATFKVPGRVGDGPIAGSAAYADDEVGACGATGDGDIMMRFLPCYQVVESMRQGMEPRHAAADAISRIARKYPDFIGAVFALNKNGVHAGACHGWTFQYSVRNSSMKDVEVFTVVPSD